MSVSYYDRSYKTNPRFIYHYKRDCYIPPPVSTFDERSSIVTDIVITHFSYPFGMSRHYLIRFFGYYFDFKWFSVDSFFSHREKELISWLPFVVFFAFSSFISNHAGTVFLIEICDLLFIQAPPVLLHRLLS